MNAMGEKKFWRALLEKQKFSQVKNARCGRERRGEEMGLDSQPLIIDALLPCNWLLVPMMEP